MITPAPYRSSMPKCPNCHYQIKRWLDADPCPECGEVPKTYLHTLFTKRQRHTVIVLFLLLLVSHVEIFFATHVPDWHGMIARIFHVHPDSLTVLCYIVAVLSPSIMVYIFVLAFERNFSRTIPTFTAVCSLFPSLLFTVVFQMLIGLLV